MENIYPKKQILLLSFKNSLILNFKKLYPLCSIIKISNINPSIMKLYVLMFNFLNYFAFNAIYSEAFDKIDDNEEIILFIQWKKKFGIIILTLLTQMLLCIIIKCLYVVRKKDRDEFENKIKHCLNNNERKKESSKFNNSYII